MMFPGSSWNSVTSSRLWPASSGISGRTAACAAASESGTRSPSNHGAAGTVPGTACRTACCAASSRSGGTSHNRSPSFAPSPSSSAYRRATCSRTSDPWMRLYEPLSMIAERNSPRVLGAVSSSDTDTDPADSPATVTRSGSPPNAAMLSRTHSSAAIWSRRPEVGRHVGVGDGREVDEAEDPQPVVEGDHHDVAGRRQLRPVVERAAPAGVGAAVDPDQDGPRRCRLRRRDHVEVEAVLAGRAESTGGRRHRRRLLRGSADLGRRADPTPRSHLRGGGEAQPSDRRFGVRNAQPGVDRAPHRPRQVPASTSTTLLVLTQPSCPPGPTTSRAGPGRTRTGSAAPCGRALRPPGEPSTARCGCHGDAGRSGRRRSTTSAPRTCSRPR